RFGEIREEHREPERDRYREDEEGRCLALSYDRLNEQKGGEPAPDVHDEHHRVLQLVRRAQLAHRIDQRPAQDSAAHQRLSYSLPAVVHTEKYCAAGVIAGWRAVGDELRLAQRYVQ